MPIQSSRTITPRADLGEAIGEFNPATEGFIAREILPPLGVGEKSGSIPAILRENLTLVDVKHANGAAFNRAAFRTGEVTYACTEKALEGPLTGEDIANAASEYDAEAEVATDVLRKLLMVREKRVADLIFNKTTWTGGDLYTDNSGSPWDTTTTEVIEQVVAAKEKVRANTGHKADTLIISEVQLNNLLINDAIKDCFPGAPLITEAMLRNALAAIFGLENLLVGGAVYNSAAEGQDFSGSDIWSDDYAMVCKLNRGSVRTGGLGRSLFWRRMDSGNYEVEQYEEPQTDAMIYRVREYAVETVFDAHFGHLIEIDG